MHYPRRFGRYELLDHLATGGMAEVFRARSFGVEGFERQVCIKRILPGLSRDPRFVSMFVKEARICAGVSHPNVVQIFELGKVGDDHFMAMELVHGRDLGRVLRAMRRSRSPMPIGVAVHIVVQALRGLACAHALTDADGRPMNVVHRDISPHNVLVGFEGETKVFDFGVAHIGTQAAPVGGGAGGKAAYMAPEQAAGRSVDARADLYAMGVVLFELLSRRRPAASEESGRWGPDVRFHRPEVPEGIARVASQLMATAREDRHASAHDAADELQAAMFEAGLRAHSGDLRRFMARLFPDANDHRRPGVVDLSGLALDVAGLGDDCETKSATPRTSSRPRTPTGPGIGRRPVVVLMAEVVGMTDVSASLESEHIFRRNLRFLRRARKVVEVHDGRVEGWQDDTLTVFFGLPAARDHDVERALACAEALVELARRLPQSAGRVELCVGVHRGEVSVGRPNGRRLRYVSHGDTVKLARHLSLVADPGEVLVSPSLARLARSHYVFADGPRLGRRSTTRGAVAQRLSHRRTRMESEGEGWVQRSDELIVISKALSALAAGEGSRLVTLGPAGSGKSRLLREVFGLARKRGVRMFSARGLPYGAGGSARILHDLLQSVLGGEGGEGRPEELVDRLARLGLPVDEVGTLRQLLMGGGAAPRRSARINPHGVVDAVASLLRAIAREQPLIVAIEDMQHLDEPERRLVAALLQQVRELPVLWWLSARESNGAGLPEPDHLIRLDSMSAEGVRSLANHILGVASLGPALWRLVSRNAEGNPLYVESILGTLRQSGRVRIDASAKEAHLVGGGADVRLPPGLDAMLAERIDALEPALRGVLQLGVTIGPRFTTRLLGEAAGLDDPLPLVESLVAQRLVVWVGDPSDGRCAIASTLIGQIVQRSLLGAHRRSCHRAVAAAIARLHADNLTPHRVALAMHCAGSGDFLDAARHGARAGRWFVEQQLLDRGGKIYQDALEHVRRAREEGADGGVCAHAEAVLRADLGACLARSDRLDAAERHLRVSLDLSAELLLPEMEAASHLELGRLLLSRGDAAIAVAHLEAARDAAVSSEGPGWRTQVAVEALEALSRVHHEAGHAGEAAHCLHEARELAGGDAALLGHVYLAQARPIIRRGEAAEARPLLDEALACARAAGDRILEGKIHNNIGILHHADGEYKAAHDRFESARRIREGLGYRKGVAINLHNIGDTWLRREESGRAWAAFSESRAIAERLQWRRGVVMNDLFLTHLELRRAEWTGPQADGLVARLGDHIRAAESLGDRESAVIGRLLLARAYRETHRLEAASEALDDAMRAAERLDARVLARDLRLEQAKVATARLEAIPHHVTGAALDLVR